LWHFSSATKKQRTFPKLKLYYFNIPGKGEAIRLACAYGEIPLDDFRMHANEFHELKVSGKIPFGQVPALSVDDDTMLFQSAAIMRYVGKLAGLYPTNDDLYAAKIDMAVDCEMDLFTGLSVSRYRGKFSAIPLLFLFNAGNFGISIHVRHCDVALPRLSQSLLTLLVCNYSYQ
jgi:hypothetical protein